MQTRLVVIEQILYTFLLFFFLYFLSNYRSNSLKRISYLIFIIKAQKILCEFGWVSVEKNDPYIVGLTYEIKKMLPLMYKPRNVQNAMKTKGHATPRTPMQSLNWMLNYHDYPLYRNIKMGDTHYKQKICTTR